jgi:hypothetical protein
MKNFNSRLQSLKTELGGFCTQQKQQCGSKLYKITYIHRLDFTDGQSKNTASGIITRPFKLESEIIDYYTSISTIYKDMARHVARQQSFGKQTAMHHLM